MKKEYDFSKGVRGKFHRKNAHLNIPIYLDDDVADLVAKYARRKKTDEETIVNKLLRSNKEILREMRQQSPARPPEWMLS